MRGLSIEGAKSVWDSVGGSAGALPTANAQKEPFDQRE